MKTTIKLDTCTYSLVVSDGYKGKCITSADAMAARIAEVTALHAKTGKGRRHVLRRAHATDRIYPPNGAGVSVREYCEQYTRANASVFGGARGFRKETMAFFGPLSARRCRAQGEYSEEVVA